MEKPIDRYWGCLRHVTLQWCIADHSGDGKMRIIDYSYTYAVEIMGKKPVIFM